MFLAPIYISPLVLIPAVQACLNRNAPKTNWKKLEMPDEDSLLIARSSKEVAGTAIKIKIKGTETREKSCFFTHTPTFLLNLALHLCYAISIANNEKENQDMISPQWKQ